MADGSFPTLVSKDRNANTTANPIYVNPIDADGDSIIIDANGNLGVVVNNSAGSSAVNIQDGGNSITVDGTVTANVGSVTVSAVDLDIRDLVYTQDSILIYANTAKDGTGTDYVPLVDADGNLQVDVLTLPAISFDTSYADNEAFTVYSSTLGAIGLLVDETAPSSASEGSVAIPRMTADRKALSVIVDATTDSQRLAINANGEAQIDLAASSLPASNPVPVSSNTAGNSEINPIYVYNVKTVTSGYEIHDYKTATPGADASDNHDYTVANTTFFLKSVIFAGSGGVKAEVQTGPVASLATVAVGFIPRQGGVSQLFFDPPVEVPVTSTGTVRVIVTNRQGAAMDVYSTIIGNDV